MPLNFNAMLLVFAENRDAVCTFWPARLCHSVLIVPDTLTFSVGKTASRYLLDSSEMVLKVESGLASLQNSFRSASDKQKTHKPHIKNGLPFPPLFFLYRRSFKLQSHDTVPYHCKRDKLSTPRLGKGNVGKGNVGMKR